MTAPIVIIGSGINALVAAADLTARGKRCMYWNATPRPAAPCAPKS